MSEASLATQHLGLQGRARDTVERANTRFARLLARHEQQPGLIGLVLAGGAAARFRPLSVSREMVEQGLAPASEGFSTVQWSKPALPVCGRALIDYTLLDLMAMGCRAIVLNVCAAHAPERLTEAVDDGAWLGEEVGVAYLVEQTPSGTYGDVIRMLDLVLPLRPLSGTTDVAIFSGDIFTTQQGREVLQRHRRGEHAFTMMLNPVPEETRGQFGTVILDESGRITEFREKDPDSPSNLNNSSRYIARLDLLQQFRSRLTPVPPRRENHLDPGVFFDFGLHLFPLLLREGAGTLHGFVSGADWADVGRVEDYLITQVQRMAEEQLRSVEHGGRVAHTVELAGPYRVDGQAEVTGESRLNNVHVGRGWQVVDSALEQVVLLPLPEGVCHRVSGSTLTRCVVGSGNLEGTTAVDRLLVWDGERRLELPV